VPVRRRTSDPVLVSAHRCGAGVDRHLENTRPALERALAAGKPALIELKVDPAALSPRATLKV